MANPPDDCAIEVKVTYDSDKPKFHLKRIPSDGSFYDKVELDAAGDLKLNLPEGRTNHRFAISFRLHPEDKSGGFAGIKIWPKDGIEPEEFFRPGRGITLLIPSTPLDLHVYFTEDTKRDKATLLSIGDDCSIQSHFFYCLGIYRNPDRKGPIDQDDPRIYNNGDPPQRLGCLGLWKRVFSSSR